MKHFPTKDKLYNSVANSEKCANVLTFILQNEGHRSYISEVGNELDIGPTLANEYIRYLERAKIVKRGHEKGIRGVRTIYTVSPSGLAKFWGWLWRSDSRLVLGIENSQKRLKAYEKRLKNPKDERDTKGPTAYLVKQLREGQKEFNKQQKEFFKVVKKLEKDKLFQQILMQQLEYGYVGLEGCITLRVMLYTDFRHLLPFVLQNHKLDKLSGKKAELYKALLDLIRLETENERFASFGNRAFYQAFEEE